MALELRLDGRIARGRRLGAMTNAGFECVAIADNLGLLDLAQEINDRMPEYVATRALLPGFWPAPLVTGVRNCTPATSMNNAVPGMTESQGFNSRYDWPSLIISPHSGVGGCTPNPRNPKPAAIKIAEPRLSVACTITGAIAFGKT